MNIHPAFVHFPVAFLTIYALCEIIPFSRFFPRVQWNSIKTFLVTIGFLGAISGLLTGQFAEELFKDPMTRRLIGVHENFAYITTIISGVLALAYIIRLIIQEYPGFLGGAVVKFKLFQWFSDFILGSAIRTILAVLGLAAITVTGALGGAIAYGPDTDPAVKFIYSLFF